VLCVRVVALNWDAFGAIAELLGAIATLVMLVYLAIQLRQNTKAIQSNSFHAANTALSDNFTKTVEETKLKFKDWEECDEYEKLAQIEGVGKYFTMYETMFYLNRDGTLNPELWKSRSDHIRLMLENPNGGAFWKERRRWFADSFRKYVDEIAATSEDDA
jgi:pullulanase/glycogen debranching enzyme